MQEGECGRLYGMFEKGYNSSASNGQYVHVPEGSGNRYGVDSSQRVEFTFHVSSAGYYEIHGYVHAADWSSDSFWLQVDNGSTDQWNLSHSSGFIDDLAWTPYFSVGDHTITVYLREDGAQLDKLELRPH